MNLIARAARPLARNPQVKRSAQQQSRKKSSSSAVDAWENDPTIKALEDMGETNAIIAVIGGAMVLTGILTAVTRSAGKKETVAGFTSISDGQPYTTDPNYAKYTKKYREFQNMDPISVFKKLSLCNFRFFLRYLD